MRSLALAANILGVDTEQLTDLLTVKRTNVRGQVIVIRLQQAEANFRKDAVSKVRTGSGGGSGLPLLPAYHCPCFCHPLLQFEVVCRRR